MYKKLVHNEQEAIDFLEEYSCKSYSKDAYINLEKWMPKSYPCIMIKNVDENIWLEMEYIYPEDFQK